ncbi:MAG: DUF6642 family protein [Candidatus Sumerlaeaceae bacterium]
MAGNNIFCLEGDWSGNLKKPNSVRPILELLSRTEPYAPKHIYRGLGTVEEFEYYLREWRKKQYRDYPILYLAFHGDCGELCVEATRGGSIRVSLDDLETLLQGKCHRRMIHIGACDSAMWHGNRVQTFLRTTGAVALMGYEAQVDWTVSTAFELLLFDCIQEWSMTKHGANAIKKRMKAHYPDMVRKLGFKVVVRK